MSESNAVDLRLDESDWHYPGWRVAVASGIGVFVSFASLTRWLVARWARF